MWFLCCEHENNHETFVASHTSAKSNPVQQCEEQMPHFLPAVDKFRHDELKFLVSLNFIHSF